MKITEILIIFLTVILLSAGGCNGSQTASTAGGKSVSAPAAPGTAPKVADPAVRKCIEDGFKVESVMKNGTAKGYVCKNPATGKKCDTWAYYRKTCHLK